MRHCRGDVGEGCGSGQQRGGWPTFSRLWWLPVCKEQVENEKKGESERRMRNKKKSKKRRKEGEGSS